MRTRNYYRVRTVVRVVVWGGLSIGLGALAVWVGDTLAGGSDSCPVRVTPSGWTATTPDPIDLGACVHPAGVRLLPGGVWVEASPDW